MLSLKFCALSEAKGMVVKMETKVFTAIINKEEDIFVAECPEIGTVSQGFTIEESLSNLKEATELYLEEFPISDVSRSILTTFEVSNV